VHEWIIKMWYTYTYTHIHTHTHTHTVIKNNEIMPSVGK
jgi:hypothetical protein